MKPITLPPPLVLGPLTRTDFVRYQGASGDMNPVHHDEPFATAAGYPGPLAVGMFAAGVMNSWASDHLGPENVRRTRVRWRKAAFPGTVLTINGKVAATRDEDQTVELEITATDQDGDIALEVWMTFVLPPESASDAASSTTDSAEVPA